MRLFRRDRPAETPAVRVYYASDIHGTEVLWRKFLSAGKAYRAQVLVMGGDITGKMVIPLVERDGVYTARLYGKEERAGTEAEVEALERRIRDNGLYPYRTTAAEVERIAAMSESEQADWFEGVMLETFDRWIRVADERLAGSDTRCFVMPGNDDPPEIERAIERAEHVESCDERVVSFDGYTMLSLGYSNRTPWNSPRELDEDDLYRRIRTLAEGVPDLSRCVFNLHVPPYDSRLDIAPELDENLTVIRMGGEPHMIPVGSKGVRQAIEELQPLAALHGHIHESPGAMRIGRTLCINPGSDYNTGRISGCLINLQGESVKHQFVTG